MRAMTLEGEVRKENEEVVTATEELISSNDKLGKKWGEVTELHQVAQGPIYQRVYDCEWNRTEEFYIRNVAKNRAEAIHYGWLACL